jgi:hypothetical protein
LCCGLLIATALCGFTFLCLHAANPGRWSVERVTSVASAAQDGGTHGTHKTAPSVPPPHKQRRNQHELAAKVEARLAEADKASAAAVQKSIERVHSLIAHGKQGAAAFASDMLGVEAKARAVIAQLPGTDSEGYTRFVRQAFGRNVLDSDDFSREMDAAARGFLAELNGIENQMLVAIRLDVGDDEFAMNIAPPTLNGATSYQDALDRLVAHTASDAAEDAAIQITRFVVAWVAADALTDPVLSQLAQLLDELGIDTDWLDSGLARLVANFCIGLAADKLTERAFQAASSDPEAAVAAKVREALDRLERCVIEGDGAHPENPGLKLLLTGLHEKRCRERAAAIRKYMTNR